MISTQRRCRVKRRVAAAVAPPALLALLLAGGVEAASWRDIDGSYALTGPDMLRSPAGEHSHFRVQLRGLSARDLYNAMDVPPGVDECTGARLKAVGNLRCVYFDNTRNYQCDFAVDLAGPRIEIGIPCP